MRVRPAVLIVAMAFFVAACSDEAGPAGGQPTAPATAAAISTPPPADTATPSPSPTPAATSVPVVPAVSVSDQSMDEDGRLTVDLVVAAKPGWIVIQTQAAGGASAVLGYAPVDEGENEQVEVTIEAAGAGPLLRAVLHVDEGSSGEFEFPGPDQPVQIDSETAAAAFEVDFSAFEPAIEVSDQDVAEDGVVTFESVVSNGPGWLVLYLDDDGEPGDMVEYMPISPGINEALTMAINWHVATPTVHAILYEDAGEVDVFEVPDVDTAVEVDGAALASSFQLRMPPDIFAIDQPVVTGEVVVERVISYGPGWLVVFFDEEGELGLIIGEARLEDGVNELVTVPVIETAVTPQLHLMIHQDLEPLGEFDFPASDPPVLYEERLPSPVTIRTDEGNYLISRDQALAEDGTLIVPLVVVDVDAWVVMYADLEGEPGEIIGTTWAPAGINRDVAVEVDPELVTDTMHVILHLDAGTTQEFDFPDGLDIPLQRNRSIINAPFTLRTDVDDE
jgi:hypothetical protein